MLRYLRTPLENLPQREDRLDIQLCTMVSPCFRTTVLSIYVASVQSSQAYSQAYTQPSSSVRICGEMLPNAAAAGLSIPSIPGFSQEQNIGICGLMTAIQIAID